MLGVLVSRRSADARAKIAMALGAVGVVLSIILFVIGLAGQDGGGAAGGQGVLRGRGTERCKGALGL